MVVAADWKLEWVSDAHTQRQRLAKNSLQRNLREEAQRRVTSSSASSSVSVVDCCWLRSCRSGSASTSVPAALSPYLFCVLSDGGVCIINTTNFAKTYVFESETTRRREREERPKKDVVLPPDTQRNRLVAIDCFLLQQNSKKEPAAPKSATAQTTSHPYELVPLLCTVVEGFICTFTVDQAALNRSRSLSMKASAAHRAIELPSDASLPDKGSWDSVCVKFSPCGSRIVAVVNGIGRCDNSSTVTGAVGGLTRDLQHRALACVLRRQESGTNDAYVVEKEWTNIAPPGVEFAAEFLCMSWWDEENIVLAAWSDGTVSLFDTSLSVIAQSCVFRSSVERFPGRVVKVALFPPAFQESAVSRASSAPLPWVKTPFGEASGKSLSPGFLVLVVDENVVIQFTINAYLQGTRAGNLVGEPPEKKFKCDSESCGKEQLASLELQPGCQTYCSEDIPIRDIALFDCLLPCTLVVLLESGALLMLDATTMDVLYNRPLHRLFPSSALKKGSSSSDGRADGEVSVSKLPHCSFFLKPREKPMTICVIEHNTAVFVRSS
uniref:Uncharacterized protein n=1 Tax=Trypanosoma congolense (strain IL3000) TaxID=1068625 RepID=G0UJP6_TRYCI|nr:conserved hypothetical protein [Trypanosoma congolense IL3000]